MKLRAPIIWGIVVGGLQAASPLAFWWLPTATVYAIGLVAIAFVYIGFAVADGRPKVIAVESGVASLFVVVAAAAITGSPWLLVAGLARPRVEGSVAAPPSVRRQHALVATVLPRCRRGRGNDHRCRDRGRRAVPPLGPKEAHSMSDNTSERYEVAVIGAGQAGLAIGHLLSLQGRRFVILEAEASVAAAWRTRWDSLVLFTPRRYDSLPGRAFPGDPDGYPTRDEVIAYLDDYAEAQALPVQLDSAVRSLKKKGDTFELVLDDRTVEADQVVVATGPFQRPRLPQFANDLAPGRVSDP